MTSLSPPVHFQPESWNLKWVSYTQYVVGSCFLIHTSTVSFDWWLDELMNSFHLFLGWLLKDEDLVLPFIFVFLFLYIRCFFPIVFCLIWFSHCLWPFSQFLLFLCFMFMFYVCVWYYPEVCIKSPIDKVFPFPLIAS